MDLGLGRTGRLSVAVRVKIRSGCVTRRGRPTLNEETQGFTGPVEGVLSGLVRRRLYACTEEFVRK